MKRIAIIGGGISGLATAQRLIDLSRTDRRPIHITLLEASSKWGGIIQTAQREGFLMEKGPDSFISEKPEALALAHRLGIEAQLIPTNEENRRSFIVRQGRLRPVPEGFQLLAPSRFWPFLTSDIFSILGKLRISADLLLPRKKMNGVHDESLASFVKRRFGQEALERMAQPMVGGIYTADPERLSLRATLPRFLDMEQEHRSLILGMWRKTRMARNETGVSGPRYSLFLSFDKGMQVLVDALVKSISDREHSDADLVRTDLHLYTRVKELERTSEHPLTSTWIIRTENDQTIEADAICLALPAYVTASLMKDTAPELSAALNQIKYASTATINFAYRRADIQHALDGFGFVVPFIEKLSVIACTFSSVKFAHRAPDDCVLLRAFVGGALQPEVLDFDDREIIRRAETDLRKLLGIRGQPLFTEFTLWTNSMPQYEVGHLYRVGELEALSRYPNLTFAGNAYRGAGIPDCVRSGERAAEFLLK